MSYNPKEGNPSVSWRGGGDVLHTELKKQRSKTDTAAGEMTDYLSRNKKTIADAGLTGAINAAWKNVAGLEGVRQSVDTANFSAQQTFDYYSRLNDSFLRIISRIPPLMTKSEFFPSLTAYLNLLYVKENAGLERAALYSLFIKNTSDPWGLRTARAAATAQDIFVENFLSYASPGQKDYYSREMRRPFMDEIEKIRGLVFKNAQGPWDVDPSFWFKTATERIDALKDVGDYVTRDLITYSGSVREKVRSTIANLVAMVAAGIMTFIVFLLASMSRLLRKGLILLGCGIFFGMMVRAAIEYFEVVGLISADILIALMPVLGAVGSVFIIASGIVMLHNVTTPLKTALDRIKKVSPRDPDFDIGPGLRELKNEIGDFARSFHELIKNLRETTISKSYFESILTTSNDAFISIDENSSIVEWNPAAERMFGWFRREAVEKQLTDTIIPAQYRERHAAGLKRFLDTGEGKVLGKTLELSALHRDGHEFPIEITIWALRRGKKYQFNAFIRDVTERKKTETQRNQLAAGLHAVQDTVMITDIEGVIEYVNPAFERVTGYGAAEAVGRKPNILKSGAQDREFYRTQWETMLSGKVWTAVVANRKKDGTLFTCEQSVIPITDASGRIINFVGVLHDITKRREMENRLIESNRDLIDREKALHSMFKDLQEAHENLKQSQNQLLQSEKMASVGQLAAGVAHEINNPMGFISNNMEILEQYIADYAKVLKMTDQLKESVAGGNLEEAKSIVEEINKLKEEINLDYIIDDTRKLLQHNRNGIERVQKIVTDLRTFSREDKNVMERVKIEDVIEGILTIVHSEIKYKARLEKDYGDTPLIDCSPQRLGQVLINLLVNALHALPDRQAGIEGTGTIEIKTYKQDEFVCVDVRDTGKGIPPEILNKIFDPFFTTKPTGQGTGLGLSVSYEIIKKHNGRITVRSKVGEGTTFTVMLPLKQQTEATP